MKPGARHSRRVLLILLAVPAALGLGFMELGYVAHQLAEADCPADVTGNPNDCWLCSHLSFVAMEGTPGFEAPGRSDIRVADLVPSADRILSADLLDTPARSPPASL